MADLRRLALTLLEEQEAAGKYTNLLLSSHKADGLTDAERASLTALLYTVTEHRLTYDYIICALSGRGLRDIDPHTLNLLRLGACQILHMRSIPDFAAVNETVELCRNRGERAFVNGVLRALSRVKDAPPMPDPKKNEHRYLSVRYSVPLPTVRLLADALGPTECRALLSHWEKCRYTDLTINSARVDPAEFAEKNGAALSGISARIPRSVNPERIEGFLEGHFFVQDRASLTAVLALDPQEGDTVVDVCACPGGKSFAAAMLMKDKGRVYSFDLHESKLSLITEGASRLGLTSVVAEVNDATVARPELIGRADKVICDVPCSGLGVLPKKPDLRYKSMDSISALPELQLSILRGSARYLRAGGELVYSTCTLNPAENSEVVALFLAESTDLERADFTVDALRSENGELALLPHIHNTDGFFIAKLRKKERI